MAIDKLIINRLNFDIEFGTETDFKSYADRISRLCQNRLPNRLESILKRHDIPDGRVVINKIEINLGEIVSRTFEDKLLNEVARALDIHLSKFKTEVTPLISRAARKTPDKQILKITKPEFTFESEVIVSKKLPAALSTGGRTATILVDITKEIIKVKGVPDVKLTKKEQVIIMEKATVSQKVKTAVVPLPTTKAVDPEIIQEPVVIKENQVHIPKEIQPAKPKKVKDEILEKAAKEVKKSEPKVDLIVEKSPESPSEPAPAQVSTSIQLIAESQSMGDLEKAFFYFLKYGRLPSNVSYELGTRLKGIVKINESNDKFFEEVDKYIKHDPVAKQRFQRVVGKDGKEFDPRVPKSFEDYFAALIFDLDLTTFSAGMGRYSIHDMINFLYADSPQKLRALLRFLMLDFPSNKTLDEKIKDLSDKVSKSGLVKILSSFVRKGASVNKSLNALNEDDHKATQREVLKALLLGTKIPVDVEIEPRIFFSEEPRYTIQRLSTTEVLDYFLTYGSLPYSSSGFTGDLPRLNSLILTLGKNQIQRLKSFKGTIKLRYESVGTLSEKAIQHLIKAINPDLPKPIYSHFIFFKQNIESGIPMTFQKSFMLHYALKDNRKSYLEEMVEYWKEQFGDSPKIIQERWKLRDDLKKELSILLNISSESLVEQLKVGYEFQNYNKDISVKNAGLVILWPFFKIYFNMLDLLNDKGNFRSMEERGRACHLLQYLAVKQSAGEEFYYPLNKILTGYPLDEPLPYEIKMTEKEVDVSNALLKNVITQWNALKGSSVDALRGSFLIRDGVLVPSPSGWLLTVEKKAYDVIMDRLPWGIGMIKLSWAPYILNVEWDRKIM